MKAWTLVKTGLTAIVAYTLAQFLPGCATQEKLKNFPEHFSKYSRPAAAQPAEAEKPKAGLEKKADSETDRSKIDVSDTEFSLIKIDNDNLINILLTGGDRQAWDNDGHERRNAGNAGAKFILREGDFRASATVMDRYHHENADPLEQETENMHVNIAQMLFGAGAYAGDKEKAEVYGEVQAGWEDTKLSGAVDGWAHDLLIGAKVGFSSKSADLLGMLSISTNVGFLDGFDGKTLLGMDKYKLEIGKDKIPVEGEYGRITGTATLQKGLDLPLIGQLYLVAKGSAMYEHFEKFAKFNTYTISAGLDKRIRFADGNIEALAGIEAFGRYKIEDFIGSSAEDAREYGILGKIQVEIADGIYADIYGMVTRPYRHGKFGRSEFEAGAQLTLIPGDIVEALSGKKK